MLYYKYKQRGYNMKKIIAMFIVSIALIGCADNGVSSTDDFVPNIYEPEYNPYPSGETMPVQQDSVEMHYI